MIRDGKRVPCPCGSTEFEVLNPTNPCPFLKCVKCNRVWVEDLTKLASGGIKK